MSIDAMKQALEALEDFLRDGYDTHSCWLAVGALRLAIEQAERQEPVAWRWKELVNGDFVSDWILTHSDPPPYATESMPLYTALPQRQPLTEEEIEKVRHLIDWTAGWSYIEFARAIERAHGIGGGHD
jgi:hypothetical protein